LGIHRETLNKSPKQRKKWYTGKKGEKRHGADEFKRLRIQQSEKRTKRDEFLEIMDEIIPWNEWAGVTFLKENLELLFAYREATGFVPNTLEPDEGWLGELVMDWVRVGKYLEKSSNEGQLPAPPTWTESKLWRREALKKLASGQKLTTNSRGGTSTSHRRWKVC